MILRAIVPGDIAAITALTLLTPEASGWSEADYASLLAPGSGGFGWVAEEAGQAGSAGERLTGFIVGRVIYEEAEILNLAVASGCRRRGAGAALVAAAISFARKQGAEKIFLEVRQSNEAARQLYGKCGFRELARRRDYYSAPREDAVVLVYPVG